MPIASFLLNPALTNLFLVIDLLHSSLGTANFPRGVRIFFTTTESSRRKALAYEVLGGEELLEMRFQRLVKGSLLPSVIIKRNTPIKLRNINIIMDR